MRELDWFDGPEEPDDPGRRRPRWFPVLVAVPWLVVVGLLVAPQLDRELGSDVLAHEEPEVRVDADPAPAERDTDPPTTVPEVASVPTPDVAAAPTTGPAAEVLEIREFRGQWRVAPGSEEAASLAIVVARAWLTGVGPTLPMPGITPDAGAYAEHLVVEAAERTSTDTEVVTVLAVLLRDVDGAAPSVAVERLAVPIVWEEDGPRPAGAPWPLPGPRLEPASPTLSPLHDDPTAWDEATSALAAAGLGTHRLQELRQAPDGPVVATIADGSDQRDVWLRPHLGGYVVAGSTLQATPDAGLTGEERP
ncbi:MAG: hypothetical protein ACNA8R_06960 [Nitriliruptoraceae bacterium]